MDAEELPQISNIELRFLERYLECGIGVQAALAVGMGSSYGSAAVQACEALKKPKIKAVLAKMRKRQFRATKITVPVLLQELAIIALSNIKRYTLDHETGVIDAVPGAPKLIERGVRKAKVRKTVTVRGRGDEKETITEYTAEIELHDKMNAIKTLLEYLKGASPVDGDHQGQGLTNADVLNALAGALAEVEEEPSEGTGATTAGAGGSVHPEPGEAGPGVHLPGG